MTFFENTAQMLMAVGVLLAVVDIAILGFATFFLTLLGLAVLSSGILLHFGVISDHWTAIAMTTAVLAGLYSVLLWKPLSKLQKSDQSHKVTTDLTGHQFVVTTDISPTTPGSYSYSGVTWRIESSDDISAGAKVEVTDVQVGCMTVRPFVEVVEEAN